VTGQFEFAGSYFLHPGAHTPITGMRPVMGSGLLTRVLRGHGVEQVERTLGQLFSLCAHAHRRTARLAIHAAQRTAPSLLPEPPSQELCLRTALDHLRSMTMDWPHHSSNWPTPCPVPLAQAQADMSDDQASATLHQLKTWLEASVLHQAVDEWLVQHQSPEALLVWCQRHAATVPPAQFLADCHATATRLQTDYCPLDVLDPNPEQQALQLRHIALALTEQASFAQRPSWQGQCAETGAWTRLRQRNAASRFCLDTSAGNNAWTRLASRWYELVELCADGQGPHSPGAQLSSGALALGHGQALGWCEMARGLLLHWVQLDSTGRVQAYQVVAPTEWNFHPQGLLARALTQLAPQDSTSATLLGQAFDACVACQVKPANPVELCDA
jgi:hypothetical protein